MGNVALPQKYEVKYLGMHLDRRLTWAKHIKSERNQLNLKAKQMHWLIGRRSTLSTGSKLLLYKAVLEPIWTYGVQLWGQPPIPTSKTSSAFNLRLSDPF
jgi:hypothetical protein